MKNYKFHIAILVLLITISTNKTYGQQDPLFTHFLTNRFVVNPAYAGTNERIVINSLYRHQWVGIDGAPNTVTFSAHGSSRNRKVGLGLYYQHDAIGPVIDQEIMAAYAYHLYLNKGVLSFGLHGGFKRLSFDPNKMYLLDEEPDMLNQTNHKWRPDLNFGIYYQASRFFAGISSKELISSEFNDAFTVQELPAYKLKQHLYLMGGYIFKLNEEYVLRPAGLFKYVEDAKLEFDANLSLFYQDVISLGVSYRTHNAISGLVQLKISKDFYLGYSYDYYFNKLESFNQGSHEIQLEFLLDAFKTKMTTPRYF